MRFTRAASTGMPALMKTIRVFNSAACPTAWWTEMRPRFHWAVTNCRVGSEDVHIYRMAHPLAQGLIDYAQRATLP